LRASAAAGGKENGISADRNTAAAPIRQAPGTSDRVAEIRDLLAKAVLLAFLAGALSAAVATALALPGLP
jgi:hypothetical protein